MIIKKLYLFLILIICSSICHADDYQDARKAEEKKDYVTALAKYRKSAEKGNANAMNRIGFLFHTGDGVVKSNEEAIRWFKLAAAKGQINSMFHLGYLYSEGMGVPQNYEISHMWFNLSVANGDESAVGNRNYVEKKMSRESIANAQRMAIQCKEKGYQNCY